MASNEGGWPLPERVRLLEEAAAHYNHALTSMFEAVVLSEQRGKAHRETELRIALAREEAINALKQVRALESVIDDGPPTAQH